MRRILFTTYCLLVIVLNSCTPPPLTPSLIVYRFDPPAFLEYSVGLQLTKEIPFSIPQSCGLSNIFTAPVGRFLLIELNCPNGQTVLFLDVETGSTSQPVTNTDSHFLAWTADGTSVYLKIDSLGSPTIIRAYPNGSRDVLTVPEFTYDLAARPNSRDFTFTLSRGLGQGSELYFAQQDGHTTHALYADLYNYISFTRFSPDGQLITFIKIPDTQTPFTVGELWVMNADGTHPRQLADADAGHGYEANWSPDGTRIAFVVRENPEEETANRSSEMLISNVYVVNVANGELKQITNLTRGWVETPHWSPDGNTLAFNEVVDGRMTLSIVDVATGARKPLAGDITSLDVSACCPVWMRK